MGTWEDESGAKFVFVVRNKVVFDLSVILSVVIRLRVIHQVGEFVVHQFIALTETLDEDEGEDKVS